MGFKVSWIGIRGLDKVTVLQRLGFADAGPLDTELDAPFSCAELPTGWIIVFANDFGWVTPARVAALSSGAAAVGCQMSEGVMYSAAWGYEDGVQQWSLVHYLDEDKELEIVGNPPAEFPAIRERLTRDQEREGEGVDYLFDAPIALTAALCGYRPDETTLETQPSFTELTAAGPVPQVGARDQVKDSERVGWLAKLFGRRS